MEKAEMIENYRKNLPNSALPLDFWFELTDVERENAESAPPSWRLGILPPEEFNRRMAAVDVLEQWQSDW